MGLFSKRDDHEVPEARDPRPNGSQKGVIRRDHQKPGHLVGTTRRTRSMILSNEDNRPPTRWWE